AGRNMRVFTVPVAGGMPTCLTPDLDRTCLPFFTSMTPQWSADGAWITFAVEDQGDVPISRVRAAGAAIRERVITGARVCTGLSRSQYGSQCAFTGTDPISPPEVFLCRAEGTGE